MNRLVKVVLLAFVSISCSAMQAHGQDITEQLDQYFSDAGLNGSVIVTHNGNTILAKGYGMANFELGVSNTSETVFRIGSITKQFTAMAILILQERGLLRVEDTVGTHVSDVPEAWKPLTIHQLLTHTSGIMHSWPLDGFGETMAVPTTLDETLSRFYDEPLLFEPGSDYRYSGTAYFLLAKLIEELSDQSFGEFLKENIFDPIGMHHTGMDTQEEVVQNRAIGYEESESGQMQNAPDIYMPILTGGGNMISTVGDMALWDAALSNFELISTDSYAKMYQPDKNNYAYGWRVLSFDETKLYQHTGGVPGFAALISRLPEKELCVIVLTNKIPFNLAPRRRLSQIYEIVTAE